MHSLSTPSAMYKTVTTFKLIIFLDVLLCLSFWLDVAFYIFAAIIMEFISNVFKSYVNSNQPSKNVDHVNHDDEVPVLSSFIFDCSVNIICIFCCSTKVLQRPQSMPKSKTRRLISPTKKIFNS